MLVGTLAREMCRERREEICFRANGPVCAEKRSKLAYKRTISVVKVTHVLVCVLMWYAMYV